jgi:hypothetical protein
MNVRFVPIDQEVLPVGGAFQQVLKLRDKGRPAFRVGPSQELLGFLPRQLQPP